MNEKNTNTKPERSSGNEVECDGLLAELLSVVCHEPECHTLHHTAREYHSADEPCPAKARYMNAIRKAQQHLS